MFSHCFDSAVKCVLYVKLDATADTCSKSRLLADYYCRRAKEMTQQGPVMSPMSSSLFQNKGDGETGFDCSNIAQSVRMKCSEQQRAGSRSCMWLRLSNKDLWLRTRERQWFQISMSSHASSHFFCIKTKTTSFPYPVVWLRCGYCISG